MAQIDNVRLPKDIEAGAEIGPVFQTSIITLTSGHEQRNQDWSGERIRANISYGMMRRISANSYADGELDRTFSEILAFYRARRGMARGFLFRDWSDYQASDVVIGVGNASQTLFPLKLMYSDYSRRITRPIASTVQVYVDGGLVGHTLNDGGIVQIAAPAMGLEVAASFDFDIPVRFNSDMMQVSMAWSQAGEIKDIELIGLRDEVS